MTYNNPEIAFKTALDSARLSLYPGTKFYVGDFMYMGTDSAGKDLFKHMGTREYLK